VTGFVVIASKTFIPVFIVIRKENLFKNLLKISS